MSPEYGMNAQAGMPSGIALGGALINPMKPQYDPSIRENLDNRIKELQAAIAALEEVKAKIPDALIDMKISDLREAMRF